MSFNAYAISILGKEKWEDLLRKHRISHNLYTKKWTKGRTSEFYKDVRKEIKKALKRK